MARICIVAGEASGDIIGGKLIQAIQEQMGPQEFFGVGGERMIELGFESLFPIGDLSVMGYAEVLLAIPRVMWRMRQLVNMLQARKPDIIITIDSPGFNFRLVRRLRKIFGQSIKFIHYVAPTVWAYRLERKYIVDELYDHLLAILPFEPKYFSDLKLQCTYVGYPVLEGVDLSIDAATRQSNLITIMPGSRLFEVANLLNIFLTAIDIIAKDRSLEVFIPTVTLVEEKVRNIIANKQFKYLNREKIIISKDPQLKNELIKKSAVALVKSGTSAMEVMLNMVPQVIAYKVSKLTAFLLKRKIKLKYVNLANIILDKGIIPELLQEKCTPEVIALHLKGLLDNEQLREAQRTEYQKVMGVLGYGRQPTPSAKAAQVVKDLLSR